MTLQKILEGTIPAVLFVYLLGVMVLGGFTLLASTLPMFTMLFAIFGAWVFARGSLKQMERNSRVKNRK